MTQEIVKRQVFMSDPQFELVSTAAPYPAFVGGFGSGKTEALTNRALYLKRKYQTCNIGYYLPTFDLVRKIAFPRFEEKLTEYGLPYKLNKTLAEIDIEKCGQIIFRTMDSPSRIIGYEVCDSLVDELDTLKIEDARAVWQKIMSRNRQKKPDGSPNTIAVGTTPEGFRFTHETWGKTKADGTPDVRPGYELIRASTYSNERNLPAGYIQSLLDLYPTNLVTAYIDGNFVNLTSGSCYPSYDRKLNASTETVRPPKNDPEKGYIAGDFLHIGMDFNVGNMSAIVFVTRDTTELGRVKGDPAHTFETVHAVAEIMGVLDTPAMVTAIKNRYPNHSIAVYPDASGGARKSNNASTSDLAILSSAGFSVQSNASNPFVKDRLLSMNAKISKRHLLVNVSQCPKFAEALEKQSFDKKGEPDKTSGFDHPNDAGGYFVCYRYPVVRPSSQHIPIAGA